MSIPTYIYKDAITGTTDTPFYNGNTISTGGTISINVTIPFTFNYYGVDYTSMYVCNHGIITLGYSSTASSNVTLPTNTQYNFICPFWDALVTTGYVIYSGVTGSSPNRLFYVGWNTKKSTSTQQMECWFYETTNTIKFVYGTTTNGSSATIGLQNQYYNDNSNTGYTISLWSFNTAKAVNNLSLTFETTNIDTNRVNIGDTFKIVNADYINVGDDWKLIKNRYINVGDDWKLVKNLIGHKNELSELTLIDTMYFPSLTYIPKMLFDSTGTKMYFIVAEGYTTYYVYQYELPIPFYIKSLYFVRKYSINTYSNGADDIIFNDDGTIMYIYSSPNIQKYNLSTAFDISTSTYSLSVAYGSGRSSIFGDSGYKIYIINDLGGTAQVRQYNLTTAYDITTSGSTYSVDTLVSDSGVPTDLFFNTNGTLFYWVNGTTNTILEYNLSTSWDISTLSYNRTIQFSKPLISVQLVYLNNYIELFVMDSSKTMFKFR